MAGAKATCQQRVVLGVAGLCEVIHGGAGLDAGVDGVGDGAADVVVAVALRAGDGIDLVADGGVALAVDGRAVEGDGGDGHGVRGGAVR